MLPLSIPTLHQPKSRMAPTPSGFLHMGNAVNFLVTWALVRASGGTLHLRIDDLDGPRFKEEVLEDIFFSLDWLGIDWDSGPSGPTEFHSAFSLAHRFAHYREVLAGWARNSDALFACDCSRRAIRETSTSGRYPGTCRTRNLPLETGKTAMRVKVPLDAKVRVEGCAVDLAAELGDFVLWRKDGLPAYQLASLIEDAEMGIDFIVRGADLRVSTAAQLFLARRFGVDGFLSCTFLHHDLLLDENGGKLSKSRGAASLKLLREAGGSPLGILERAADFLGLPEGSVGSLADLRDGAGWRLGEGG